MKKLSKILLILGLILMPNISLAGNSFKPATLYKGYDRVPVYSKAEADSYFSLGYKLELRKNKSQLGISIPTGVANFETSLASPVSSSATSMTLVNGTTDDGNELNGLYGFVIDNGSANQEYVLATCVSTACSGMTRGISVETGNTSITALKKDHRRGALVQITDHPLLITLARILNGQETTPGGLTFGTSSITGLNKPLSTATSSAANVEYVNDAIVSGGVPGTETTPGVWEGATQAEMTNGTATSSYSGTDFNLLLQNKYANATSSATTIVPVTKSNGKLSQGFLDLSEDFTFTGTTTMATTSISNLSLNGQALTGGIATQKSLTAGETITGGTTPVPVFIAQRTDADIASGDIISNTTVDNSYQLYSAATNAVLVQTFTIPTSTELSINKITSVKLSLKKNASPTGDMYVAIVASGNTFPALPHYPLNTALAYNAALLPTSFSEIEFDIADVDVRPGGTYGLAVYYQGGSSTNRIETRYNSSSVYAGGNVYGATSLAANYAARNTDIYFKIVGSKSVLDTTVGRPYYCDANDTTRLVFDGFAVSSATAGNSITVQTSGTVAGFTGLTQGKKYYVQDDGSIGILQGTYRMLVGTAISSTELSIEKDNFSGIVSNYDSYQIADDTEEANTDKEIIVRKKGSAAVYFQFKGDTTTVSSNSIALKLNTVTQLTTNKLNDDTYIEVFYILPSLNIGDSIVLDENSSDNGYLKNFRLYYDYVNGNSDAYIN